MEQLDYSKIEGILKRYGVEYAGVFGSFAKNKAEVASDIDILVRLKEPIGLFALAELQAQLTAALDRRVDLVTEGGLSPHIRDNVMREMKPVYGKR